MKWVSRLYIFFLGIILTITTGFGVAAFYPQPSRPTYPTTVNKNIVPQSCYATPQLQTSPECQIALQKQQVEQQQEAVAREQYDNAVKIYENKNAGYTRTAIFFGIVIGVLFAIIGLGLLRKSKLVATGLLLASVLTAILTRLLIGLASLGVSVTSTAAADPVAYMEFGVLFILSVAIIIIGLYSLKDQEPINSIPLSTSV